MTWAQVQPGFWVGLAIISGITIAYIAVCWLLPPKRHELDETDSPATRTRRNRRD